MSSYSWWWMEKQRQQRSLRVEERQDGDRQERYEAHEGGMEDGTFSSKVSSRRGSSRGRPTRRNVLHLGPNTHERVWRGR